MSNKNILSKFILCIVLMFTHLSVHGLEIELLSKDGNQDKIIIPAEVDAYIKCLMFPIFNPLDIKNKDSILFKMNHAGLAEFVKRKIFKNTLSFTSSSYVLGEMNIIIKQDSPLYLSIEELPNLFKNLFQTTSEWGLKIPLSINLNRIDIKLQTLEFFDFNQLKSASLSLTNCSVDVGVREQFVKKLTNNNTLQSLSLQIPAIEGYLHNQDDFILLFESLKHNTTLIELDISGLFSFTLKPSDIKYISEMLQVNKSITSLDLKNCQIGELGAEHFMDMLMVNTTLTSLNLKNNNIRDRGACFLARSLEKNTTLKWLNLDNNHIEQLGALSVGEALSNNSTLKTLYFDQNLGTVIDEHNMATLKYHLRNNTTLECLSSKSYFPLISPKKSKTEIQLNDKAYARLIPRNFIKDNIGPFILLGFLVLYGYHSFNG